MARKMRNPLNLLKILKFSEISRNVIILCKFREFSQIAEKLRKSVPAPHGTQETCPDREKPKELHRFWRGKSARGSSKSAQIFKDHDFRTLDDFLVEFLPKW